MSLILIVVILVLLFGGGYITWNKRTPPTVGPSTSYSRGIDQILPVSNNSLPYLGGAVVVLVVAIVVLYWGGYF